jgi:hypothetical protein
MRLRRAAYLVVSAKKGCLDMKSLTEAELARIKGRMFCVYQDVLARYDDKKYPEKAYQKMLSAFSGRSKNNREIENPLKWKWGHWGKKDYPQHHKNLISLVESLWPKYLDESCLTPCETFEFWKTRLEKQHRYISVAFLTHLLHAERVPIIDQHNFRAMNHLLQVSGRKRKSKKKPSNWEDIRELGIFVTTLSEHLKRPVREVDKFLMMYGRYCAPR